MSYKMHFLSFFNLKAFEVAYLVYVSCFISKGIFIVGHKKLCFSYNYALGYKTIFLHALINKGEKINIDEKLFWKIVFVIYLISYTVLRKVFLFKQV